MEIKGTAKLLRIFVGESDKVGRTPVYELIVKQARERHLAGATAYRGMLGFGPSARIRSAKILDLSSDLPMVVEIVDEESKIEAFRPILSKMIEESGKGGMVTLGDIRVVHYKPGS